MSWSEHKNHSTTHTDAAGNERTKMDHVTITACEQDTSGNGVYCINLSEEDQMEVCGYERCWKRTALSWVGIVLSVGFLRLIFYWHPRIHLYATHRRCSVQTANALLLLERHNKKIIGYHVEKLQSLNSSAMSGDIERASSEVPGKDNLGPTNLEFHVGGGYFKAVDAVQVFDFKKHRYYWDPESSTFNRLRGLDHEMPVKMLLDGKGLSPAQQIARRAVYGLNVISIPRTSLSALIFEECLNPFYIFEMFAAALWAFEEYYLFASTIFFISLGSVLVAAYQARKNQKSLRNLVESHSWSEVYRNGERVKVATELMVPGDLFVLPAQGATLMCDAVLVSGSCVVNESTLTGESVPVTKTPLAQTEGSIYEEKRHVGSTLYCGTLVLQSRGEGGNPAVAVCIRTGFATTKGTVVRSVLYPPPIDFKFERDSYKFVTCLALTASVGFACTIYLQVSIGEPLVYAIFAGLDLITTVVPPALPVAITVGCLHAQSRLRRQASVFCISPRSVIPAGTIDCVCFDKTGTLTEDDLDVWGVVPIDSGHLSPPVRDVSTLPSGSRLLAGLATCHTLIVIDNQLMGDPLDMKMFQSTKWTLEEAELTSEAASDVTVTTVIRPPSQADSVAVAGIVKQLPFKSELSRMSVVVKELNSSRFTLYCKGAPEKLASLCLSQSVPEGFNILLDEYTQKGYRVIAIAYKELEATWVEIDGQSRSQLESQLNFLGLIVLENLLKPESSQVVQALHDAGIRTIMVTGDNLHTAVSVAKECGMVGADHSMAEVQANPPNVHYINLASTQDTIHPLDTNLGTNHRPSSNFELVERSNLVTTQNLALTGDTWSWIRADAPDVIPNILTKGAVFARMNPEHKMQLVQDLKASGYCVAMVGDGANDCGALRAAEAGVSLSEAEASAAAAFVASTRSVDSVLAVIKEGRTALVTSLGLFKYMAAYSLVESFSVLLLYSDRACLSDNQFIYIDLGLLTAFAYLLGHSPPSPGPLVPGRPETSLLSRGPLLSLACQLVVMIGFQMVAFLLLPAFRGYAIFNVSSLQYVVLALVFYHGLPHRAPVFSDSLLIGATLLAAVLALLFMFLPDQLSFFYKTRYLRPATLPSELENRLLVLGICLLNVVTSFVIEWIVR